MCWNLTRRPERTLADGTEVIYGRSVFLLDPFSLVCVGLYKLSVISENSVPMSPAEIKFEGTERVAGFRTGAFKKDIVSKISTIVPLKVRRR